ncbi:MAG: hypothetical protein IKF42_08260 [Mogibacterium sp.]|nr:hypothetical protein [Mogibacterium sp.]
MNRDVIFFAAELGGYVTINADIKVNVGADRDIVQIELPRMSKHYRVEEILAKKKYGRLER